MLRWGVVVLGVAVLVFAGYRLSLRYATDVNTAQERSELLPAGSDAGYVDSAACMGCHREIWETYQQTGMGRSLTRPRPEVMVDFTKPIQFYHKASDQHFTV